MCTKVVHLLFDLFKILSSKFDHIDPFHWSLRNIVKMRRYLMPNNVLAGQIKNMTIDSFHRRCLRLTKSGACRNAAKKSSYFTFTKTLWVGITVKLSLASQINAKVPSDPANNLDKSIVSVLGL